MGELGPHVDADELDDDDDPDTGVLRVRFEAAKQRIEVSRVPLARMKEELDRVEAASTKKP